MDFLDPKKKRAHITRLYIGYALMAIIITISTFVIGFFSFGFKVDPKTGDVVQNGLIFFNAQPESAKIFVNGKDEGQTDTRLVLPAASYDIELRRDGYRTWRQNLVLEGGKIERLVYPLLFPEKLTPTDAQLFASSPRLVTQSPDKKWLVANLATSLNDFELSDLSAENTEPKKLTIPPTVLTQAGSKHVITAVEWSTDNRHILLKHEFDAGVEFVIFDREETGNALNLNAHFARTLTHVTLKDKKHNQFFMHDTSSGDLVSALSSNKEIVQIASGVLAFQPHGDDKILYATKIGAPAGKVLIKMRSGNDEYIIRDLPESPAYLLDLARFDGKWYVAVGSSTDQRVFVYVDPIEELKSSSQRALVPSVLLRLNGKLEYLSFSTNTRFISIQSGSSFAVYDAETKRQYRYDTKLPLSASYQVRWIDGHRLGGVSNNKLMVFDFDGTNMQSLVTQDPSFQPFFDRNFDNLFTISPSTVVGDKTALTRTSLLAKKN